MRGLIYFIIACTISSSWAGVNSGKPIVRWTYRSQSAIQIFQPVAGALENGPCCEGQIEAEVFGGSPKHRFWLQPPIGNELLRSGRQLSWGERAVGSIVELDGARSPMSFYFQTGGRSNFYSGVWQGDGVFGDLEYVQREFTARFYYNLVIPLINAFILLVLAIVFAWLHFAVARKQRIFKRLSIFSGLWAAFFVSLAGVFRTFDFVWGAVIHLPLRVMASVGLLMLIAELLHVSGHRLLRRAQLVLCLFAFVALALGVLGLPDLQRRGYVLVSLIPFLAVVVGISSSTRLSKVQFMTIGLSSLAFVGQILDSLKLLEPETGLIINAPYFNRFTTLPIFVLGFSTATVLLRSMYISSRLSKARSAFISRVALKSFENRADIDLERGARVLRVRSLEAIKNSFVDEELKSTYDAIRRSLNENFSRVGLTINERNKAIQVQLDTEARFSRVVKQLDPALYDFITRKGSEIDDQKCLVRETGIVFFDQKGYSTLLESMSEQKAQELTITVSRWVIDIASRYGVRIRNFSGDSFTLEVHPFAGEGLPGLAVRVLNVAWDLASSLDVLNHELAKRRIEPISFRFGAHIGTASGVNLDFISPGLSNLVGDNVNIAARLQSLARPGVVFVSGEIAKLSGERFLLRCVPRKYVKGRRTDIEVFELIGRHNEQAA